MPLPAASPERRDSTETRVRDHRGAAPSSEGSRARAEKSRQRSRGKEKAPLRALEKMGSGSVGPETSPCRLRGVLARFFRGELRGSAGRILGWAECVRYSTDFEHIPNVESHHARATLHFPLLLISLRKRRAMEASSTVVARLLASPATGKMLN